MNNAMVTESVNGNIRRLVSCIDKDQSKEVFNELFFYLDPFQVACYLDYPLDVIDTANSSEVL